MFLQVLLKKRDQCRAQESRSTLLPTYKAIVQNDTNNELLKKENTCPKQFCEAITYQSPQFPFGILLIRLRMCPRGSGIKVLVTWVLLGGGGKLET